MLIMGHYGYHHVVLNKTCNDPFNLENRLRCEEKLYICKVKSIDFLNVIWTLVQYLLRFRSKPLAYFNGAWFIYFLSVQTIELDTAEFRLDFDSICINRGQVRSQQHI